jgi:SAM-dependent methyltransferase
VPGNSLTAFLAWLDIIPGRHWLAAGDADGLAAAIQADYKPSGVTSLSPMGERLPFPDGNFDVAVAAVPRAPALELLQELRRVVFPSGTVGLLVCQASQAELEALLRRARLHAVHSRADESAVFARGAR